MPTTKDILKVAACEAAWHELRHAADWHWLQDQAEPTGPVCLSCNQPCDLYESKVPVEFTPGVPSQAVYKRVAVSFCCHTGYVVPNLQRSR